MTLYGGNFYGLFKYGREALVEYNASPFTASSLDYGRIDLKWVPPTGTWTKIRLVRNTFGFPMTPDDGDILIDGVNVEGNPFVNYSYSDTGQVPNYVGLKNGHTYYYSLFVLGLSGSDPKWFNAGTAIGVSVKNYGTADLMYEYLPTMYKLLDIRSSTDSSDYDASGNTNSDLYNFIKVFAFEHDMFKTYAENAKNRYDILNVDGRLIPIMMQQFGLAYERELGLQQGRRMLQNISNIYLEKGSLSGVKTFVKSFTGYNCSIGAVKNLMLSKDDSSFETSVGVWDGVANATLARGTATSESPAVSPYQESTSPANFPNLQAGFLKVTPSSSADVTIYCGSITDATKSKNQGIPVVAGQHYAFTIYCRAKTTAKAIKTGIKWIKRDGTVSSTTTAEVTTSSGTFSTSAWARTTVVTDTAPADAVWAIPYVTIVSAASGEIIYFDAAQFEKASAATPFVDARRIDIYLQPNRVNQIVNPSFETVTTNWVIAGGTGSVNATAPTGVGSSNSLKIAATGTASTVTSSNYITVTPLDQYAFSAYVKGPVTDKVTLSVLWYDSGNNLVATSTGPLTTLTTSWSRVSMVASSISTAVKAKVKIEFTTANGHEVWTDALLFEPSGYVLPYFDGSAGYMETNDLLWETTNTSVNDAVNGRGLYYLNRVTTYKRLKAVLQDYLPADSTWATFIGYVS